ncbi:MAG: DUF4394 domain-containing protein [Aeromicrobium sp.]
MSHPSRILFGLAAAALMTVATVAVASSASAAGKTTLSSNEALGLGDNGTTLRIFELNDPDDDEFIASVSGLMDGDTKLIGIDYRVQDDKFYGVGDDEGVYTINTKTGAATKVSELTVALSGTHFDIDFNPAADRLRVISDNGQNLRHQLGGTTTNDGVLDYAGVTAPGVTGAAYTNNDLSPDTATTLFDIDSNLDQVAIQLPPNDGTLNLTGKLGIGVSQIVGFDIQNTVSSGRTVSNTAYASLRSSDAGEPNLYQIDVLSGKATKVDDFDKQIADIAVKQP